MSLTISRSRVKEKCGIGDSTYDTSIDNLITELLPVIEASIDTAYVGSEEVLPTLNLGATEIVCSEVLTQLNREPGATEGFAFNGLQVFGRKGLDDAGNLKAQGVARLAPFLRPTTSVVAIQGKETAE